MNLVLISGENDSGKSLFAEKIVSKINGRRYYIATMISKTDENSIRIKKHIKQRKCLNFTTLELPFEVGNAEVSEDGVVLLEDVSNILANAIFEKNKTADNVLADIFRLQKRCKTLIVVTISGLVADGYDKETADYINGLNYINEMLLTKADIAVVMKNNKPMCQKGDINDIF